MSSAAFQDDGLSAAGDASASAAGDTFEEDPHRARKGASPGKWLFAGCEGDPAGSVHRAWALTVLFAATFAALACVEARKLQQYGDVTAASVALEIAAVWSALIHLGLAAFGTFVLRRLRTAFAIGCLLGTTAVVSQQDLLLCVGFYKYQHGDPVFNMLFADLAFGLAMVLAFFSLMLGHFRKHVIVR